MAFPPSVLRSCGARDQGNQDNERAEGYRLNQPGFAAVTLAQQGNCSHRSAALDDQKRVRNRKGRLAKMVLLGGIERHRISLIFECVLVLYSDECPRQ